MIIHWGKTRTRAPVRTFMPLMPSPGGLGFSKSRGTKRDTLQNTHRLPSRCLARCVVELCPSEISEGLNKNALKLSHIQIGANQVCGKIKSDHSSKDTVPCGFLHTTAMLFLLFSIAQGSSRGVSLPASSRSLFFCLEPASCKHALHTLKVVSFRRTVIEDCSQTALEITNIL